MNLCLTALLPLARTPHGSQPCYAIDIGAHHGEFSKFLIQTGFFAQVLAFEPNPQSHSMILSTVFSQPTCEFVAVNVALSGESGTLDLYCDANTATASLLPYDSNYRHHGQVESQPVSVVTIDEYLKTHTYSGRLLCLKIDTQGHDLTVIIGGKASIAAHRPIIQTEFIYIPLYENQCSPEELSQTLAAMDYHMYSLNNLHITPEGRLAFCDAVFVPNELALPVSQEFACIDDQISFMTQIETLTKVCAERLSLINLLDAEVQHLKQVQPTNNNLRSIIRRFKSWVQ